MTLEDFIQFRIKDYLSKVSQIEVTQIGFYDRSEDELKRDRGRAWFCVKFNHFTRSGYDEIIHEYYFEGGFTYIIDKNVIDDRLELKFLPENKFKFSGNVPFPVLKDISEKMEKIYQIIMFDIPTVPESELKKLGIDTFLVDTKTNYEVNENTTETIGSLLKSVNIQEDEEEPLRVWNDGQETEIIQVKDLSEVRDLSAIQITHTIGTENGGYWLLEVNKDTFEKVKEILRD